MSVKYSHTLDPNPANEIPDEPAPAAGHDEDDAERVKELSDQWREQVQAEAQARQQARAAGEREPGSPGRPDEVSEPGVSPDAPGEGKENQDEDQADDVEPQTESGGAGARDGSGVPDGTVQDVLDWVGDDQGRAQEALNAERNGQNRTTLVAELERRSA